MTEIRNSQNCKVCGIKKRGIYCSKCGENTPTAHNVMIVERVKLWDGIRGFIKSKLGKKPKFKFSSKNMPSGDKKLPEGVNQILSIDRENNKYDQVVTDLKTGGITHEEHTLLTEHFSK